MATDIVPALPASTLLVLRDGPQGPEVLMLRRSTSASFMSGVWVFPGGGVDTGDSAPELLARVVGHDDESASKALGVELGGRSFFVAAVREVFEEAGILLAVDDQGRHLGPEAAERLGEHRRALNAGETSFVEVLETEGLTLDLSALGHHAHWITPTAEVKRFDTYFFAALAPEAQEAVHDDAETIASGWTTPAEALERHRAGDIHMVMPTIRNLAFIAAHDTAAEVVAASKATRNIPTILPKVIEDEDDHLLIVPGDEGYDEADGLTNHPKAFARGARRRALKENPPHD
jgi:8-oxo-dGTP pyrophosphatase MutT (NUDIX family)